MTGITIATAAGGIATKQCRQTSKGPVFTDYPNEKWWRFREVPIPSDAAGWEAFLEDRVNDFSSCCIYGQPINENARLQRRLLYADEGTLATLREVPRDYLILDLDSTPIPAGLDFLKEPVTAVGAVLDTIEELTGCAFLVAISSSAGFKTGVRAKAIVRLHQPFLPSEMRRWAKGVNMRFNMKLVDPAVLAPAQPIYFARPIFFGVPDPFPHRVYTRHGREHVVLAIPSEAAMQMRPEGIVVGGGGWRVHLTRLGALGFHDPLLAAAGAVVYRHCCAPVEPVASAIHGVVREAVLRADPGSRGAEEIARYASRRFWDDAIAHAARCETDRARRIAATIAGIRMV